MKRRLALDGNPPLRPVSATHDAVGGHGCVPAAEGGHVGRLRAVQQVARGEDARPRRAERRVHAGTARAGVQLEPAHHSELVVGDPVGREHDGVALDRAGGAAVEVGELDLLHPRPPVDRRQQRCASRAAPASGARTRAEERQRLVTRQLGDHAHRPCAPVREREERGEAHVLGADDQRPLADPPPLQVHELLERPGRHDALRPRAGHEPRRARALTAARGQDQGVGLDRLAAARPRELERPVG